jgi:hypothetical protein
MKPPYDITATILKLTTSISEKLGEVKAYLVGYNAEIERI